MNIPGVWKHISFLNNVINKIVALINKFNASDSSHAMSMEIIRYLIATPGQTLEVEP